MKLRNNKKGFTIVELVIVIAVIAILAAVLIPNLSRLVNKANESKAMQEAKNAYEAYLLDETKGSDGKTAPAEEMDSIYLCIKSGDYYYHVVAGQFSAEAKTACPTVPAGKTLKTATVTSGNLVIDSPNHSHTANNG